MTPQVYVNRIPVATLAPVTSLVLACEWPDGSGSGVGGPVSAQFTVQLAPAKRPGWLTKYALAEVRLGSHCLLAGWLTEPDWSTGTISIEAAATEGSACLCLDGSGNLSSTPDTILDAAISRGALTWNRPASISTSPLVTGDTTASLNYVTDMLGQYATLNTGSRVYVDALRSVRVGGDPTLAEVFLTPGTGELPWVTEAQATRLAGRWADSSGNLSTAFVGSGPIEKAVDLTPVGPLTSTTATALLNSALTQATAGGWGGGLTISSYQILGMLHLGDVFNRAARGLIVRLLGQRDPRPDHLPVNGTEFIVERAEWHVADNVIVLTPRGMVARDFSAVLADLGVQEAA